QRKITKDSAEEAYQSYLAQFSELSHLRICGSYYDVPTCTYYFFGRTQQQDPPVVYCRKWDQTTWTPWWKVQLAIDAPYGSAVRHLGQLYIFWVDSKVKQETRIQDGTAEASTYWVKTNLVYSAQKSDGKWLPAQRVEWLYPPPQAGISIPY